MRYCVLALVTGLLSACMPAGRHSLQPRDLTTLLEARVKDRRAVGIAVGVLEADGSSRVAFAGEAGPGARPLSSRSGFEIGSITKTFTGILLAEMVRTGEVRYDDPVSRYLPDNVRVPSRNGREITLLDLATHQSGLPSMPDNIRPADPSNYLADYSVTQMYAFLSGSQLLSDPGTTYRYSNFGSGLLGHALSRAANTPYEELVRERILGPLQMQGTAIELRDGVGEFMVRGHNNRGFVVPYWDLPTLAGAGAFRSNLDDLMRFLEANLRSPATDLDRSLRTVQQPRGTASDSVFVRRGIDATGMGWHIRYVGDSRIVWKDGGTAGFQTFIGFDPERKVGVVVLSNTAIEVDDIGFHLINPDLPLGEPRPMPLTVDVPVSVLQDYLGEYSLEPRYSVVVTLEGGVLSMQGTDEDRLPLFAESENQFYLKDFDARLTFTRDRTGAVTGLVLHAGDTEMQGRKVRRAP